MYPTLHTTNSTPACRRTSRSAAALASRRRKVKRRSRRLLVCFIFAAIVGLGAANAEDTVESDSEFTLRVNPNFPVPGTAEGRRFFTYEAHVQGLIQLDRVWPDAVDISPFTTLFGEVDARANFNFGTYFSVNSLLRFTRGVEQTTSSVFSDEVLYVQRLFGVVHLLPVHLYAGKIHPRFGVGWYATPGLYGTDYNTDYELFEKVGGGIRWDIRAFGRHRFTAEVFHTDTSFLSNSLIPGTLRPGLLNLQDGGAGNTDTFESFAFALNGQQMPGLKGLSYQIGWATQKASPIDVRDENSWSIAAMWNFNIFGNFTLEPMGEFVSVTGQGGAYRDVDYLTLAATLRRGPWAFAIHTTQRYVRDYTADSYRTDSLAGAAVAYELADLKSTLPWLNGFTAIFGIRQSTTFGITGQTVGVQLKYTLDF